jgi:ABC-type dipeptide/oligopeptide/nickel transport system ATPase component
VAVLFSSHQLDLVQDLCQDVVIIEHGRVVLAGELSELRAKVPQRFIDIRYREQATQPTVGRKAGTPPGSAPPGPTCDLVHDQCHGLTRLTTLARTPPVDEPVM